MEVNNKAFRRGESKRKEREKEGEMEREKERDRGREREIIIDQERHTEREEIKRLRQVLEQRE